MKRTERDATRIVRSWLEEGADRIPDRVLDAVEVRLHATRQRRAGWLAQRFPIMNNTTVRYGLAALAIIVIAVLGVRFLPGDGNIGGPQPTPTPTPTIQATPTPEPPSAFPRLGTQDELPAGRYDVAALLSAVTVEVPAGWSSSGGWVVIGPKGNEAPDGMAIRFFTAMSLLQNPAAAADGEIEVGPTVDDLVQALGDHPALDASSPADIAIDGRPGQMVELTIPADAEMDGDRYLIFADGQGGYVWGWAPGQTFELYIVDVDGERLIVDAFHYPDTSDEDLAAQRAVVDSIQFDATP